MVYPNMNDVPFGEPRKDYHPKTISQGLQDIADWFDIYDDRLGTPKLILFRTVQRDLRRWAIEIISIQEKARKYDIDHQDDHYDPMG